MPLVRSVAAAVAALAAAALPAVAVKLHAVSGTVATMEMHMFRSDCGRTHTLSRHSLRAAAHGQARAKVGSRARMPGAGMDPESITPFDKVLKDGFYEVACVKDMLFTYGDKFHDNKFEYNLGEIANVSIVHYDSLVAKADREPMTHEVCFDFCRTIPDMTFFGLQNGRMCYCAPYFKAMESDSTMCDAVCPGKPTSMCGGKMKSSIFAMHQCDSTAADLSETSGKMEEVDSDMMALQKSADDASKGMQSAADTYQAMFSKSGDPTASDLMQSAKVFAGVIEETAGRASALSESIGTLKTSGEGMKKKDFTEHTNAKAAEDAMADMEEAAAKGEALSEELQGLLAQAAPNVTGETNASSLYYPAMYFVDKEFKEMPSTCGGEPAGKPVVGSMDVCARACDAAVHDCVGFSFFPPTAESSTAASSGPATQGGGAGGGKLRLLQVGNSASAGEADSAGICFLFSKMKSVTYYTKCDEGGAAFLQARRSASALAAADVKCVVKFAEFEGATLKPNPSGKCDLCLKEATKADRCFK